MPSIETVLVIEPGRADLEYWRDLWRYRELFLILVWRDLAVRYKQTLIGVAWAVVRPLLTVVVLTFVFGRLAGLPSEGDAPYTLTVFAGILPWMLFSTSLSEASTSLIGNERLISKVYFPRLIIPMATVVTALVDFAISLVILVAMMLWFHFLPGPQILMLPAFAVLAILVSLGPGLWITALNVKYRDFRYVVPFLVQIGFYVSPVGFSSNVVPTQWRLVYSLNPMVGVIDGFRWCLLGSGGDFNWASALMSLGVVFWFLWFGVSRFRRMEKSFADVI